MKKTGIAAMMLSTAIAVSSIAVPVCAAPGQTAESAQMQEQPQTECALGVMNWSGWIVFGIIMIVLYIIIMRRLFALAGELDNAEDIKAAISEGEKEFGVSLDESTRTTLASALQQLNGIGLNHETVIALAQKMYESYGDTLVENLSDALQEQLAGPLGETIQEQLIEPAKETVMETAKAIAANTAQHFWQDLKQSVIDFLNHVFQKGKN